MIEDVNIRSRTDGSDQDWGHSYNSEMGKEIQREAKKSRECSYKARSGEVVWGFYY